MFSLQAQYVFLPQALTNRNKFSSAVTDFHHIIKEISGDDEAGLIKHVLKKTKHSVKNVFNEHLLERVHWRGNRCRYFQNETIQH